MECSDNPGSDCMRMRGVHPIATLVLIAEDLFFAQRMARASGQSIWNPATYQAVRAILPGVFVALVLSYAGPHAGLRDSLSAIWSLGYGSALWSAGMFSTREVTYYGVVQLLTGAVVVVFLRDWPYAFYLAAGLSFGVYQMLFGLLIAWKR